MKTLFLILVILLASVNSLMTRFALVRLRQPTTPAVWMVKVFVSALSPIFFIIGVLTAFCGILLNSLLPIVIGSSGALLYLIHIFKITSAPDSSTGLKKAFGERWEDRIPQERKNHFLRGRY